MPLTLPPPPKNRGIAGLIVTLIFVGWTGYLLATYDKKPAAEVALTTPRPNPGPVFVEIDLRGPKYDTGRYEGYQKGKEAKLKGFTMPAENVLSFSAAEEAKSQAVIASEMEDFTAGYKFGFVQAMK